MLLTNDNLQTGINQTGSHSKRTEDHQGHVMKTKVDTDKLSLNSYTIQYFSYLRD